MPCQWLHYATTITQTYTVGWYINGWKLLTKWNLYLNCLNYASEKKLLFCLAFQSSCYFCFSARNRILTNFLYLPHSRFSFLGVLLLLLLLLPLVPFLSHHSHTHIRTSTNSTFVPKQFQNDTMRVVFMYHESDPLHGSVVPGSLPNTRKAFKGYKPLSITQRQPQDETMSTISFGSLLASSSSSSASSSSSSSSSLSATSAQLTGFPSQSANSKLHVFELLNEDVKLPAMETLYWCKVFEFQEFSQKQHLVKVSYFLFKFLTSHTIFAPGIFATPVVERAHVSIRTSGPGEENQKRSFRLYFQLGS